MSDYILSVEHAWSGPGLFWSGSGLVWSNLVWSGSGLVWVWSTVWRRVNLSSFFSLTDQI